MRSVDKVRDLRFDNIKGVLIILVVVGHYLWGYRYVSDPVSLVVCLIYLFHMPAFIFVSGYFSKDTLPIAWRGIAELMVSYFLINTTIGAFAVAFRDSSVSLLSPYYSCWYLLALVFWRISLPFFARYRFALVLSFVISIAVGFSGEFTNRFALARTIGFYPFFLGGFLFKKAGLATTLTSFKRSGLVGILLFVAAMVAGYYAITELGINTGDMMMTAYKDAWSIEVIRRVVIIVLAAAATLGLFLALPSKRIPLVTGWGKNSLTIYLFHRYFPLIMLGVLPASQFNDVLPQAAAAAVLLSFVTLFVFGTNRVEGRYRSFVKKVVAIMFAAPDDRRSWAYRQALVLLVAFVIIAAMLARGLLAS